MNITFTPEPIPELILASDTLATLGFTCGTPLQLTLQNHTLWIPPVVVPPGLGPGNRFRFWWSADS